MRLKLRVHKLLMSFEQYDPQPHFSDEFKW